MFLGYKNVLDVYLIQRELQFNGRVVAHTTLDYVRSVISDNHPMQSTDLGICGTAS